MEVNEGRTAGEVFEVRSIQDADGMRLVVSGELDLARVGQLKHAIRRAKESTSGGITIDLTDLEFIDSTGLSLLLRTYAEDREDGRRFRFVASKHEAVERLVALTGTGKMFG